MKIALYDDDKIIDHIEYNSILDDMISQTIRGRYKIRGRYYKRIGEHKGLTRLEGKGRYAEILGTEFAGGKSYAKLVDADRAQELIYGNKNKNSLLKEFPELRK